MGRKEWAPWEGQRGILGEQQMRLVGASLPAPLGLLWKPRVSKCMPDLPVRQGWRPAQAFTVQQAQVPRQGRLGVCVWKEELREAPGRGRGQQGELTGDTCGSGLYNLKAAVAILCIARQPPPAGAAPEPPSGHWVNCNSRRGFPNSWKWQPRTVLEWWKDVSLPGLW